MRIVEYETGAPVFAFITWQPIDGVVAGYSLVLHGSRVRTVRLVVSDSHERGTPFVSVV